MSGAMWQHRGMAEDTQNPLALDVRVLRRRLAQAVDHFDEASALHREVSRRLIERLDYILLNPTAVLDLGCATGLNTQALRKRYPKARHMAMDYVPGLVAKARRQSSRWRPIAGICGELEALPFQNNRFDLIVSNLVLHRAVDLHATAREIQRVLRPGGVLLFATFGPDTLTELRQAWQAVDETAHVHGFVDMHDIGDALVSGRLADPVMDMEHFTLTYPDVSALVADLTGLGLRNALKARRGGLTTPRQWQQMQSAYHHCVDQDGRLPATWEIAYGHAWGTDAQPQITNAEGEVRVPLASLSVPRRDRSR